MFAKRHNKPDRLEINNFLGALQGVRRASLQINRFPKGIDNTYIDVALSPKFTASATRLVRGIIRHEVAVNIWGEPPSEPNGNDVEEFRGVYTGMMEVAVHIAQRENRRELIQLLQLSVLKYTLLLAKNEIRQFRNRLQRARSEEARIASGKELELHERITALSREEPALRFLIVRTLLQQIHKLDSTVLRKLRKSLLGVSWPLSKHLLFNPMLQVPSLRDDEQLMNHYTILCTDNEHPELFFELNRIVIALFEPYLPEWVRLPSHRISPCDEQEVPTYFRQRLDQGELNNFLETEMLLSSALDEEEYANGKASWLDAPENITLLTRHNRIRQTSRFNPFRNRATSRWPKNRQDLVRAFHDELHKAGLVPRVLASYEAPKLYRELGGWVPIRMIIDYLAGGKSQDKLLRRLSAGEKGRDPGAVTKQLDQVRTRINRLSFEERCHITSRFLKDFALFRRDLKHAYRAHQAMDQIRILERPREIELSRANNSLNFFITRNEQEPEQDQITKHVIIKADVRGSTAMTAELRERKLNPASHFSLNFFGPINSLLDEFGASKVFVEGDAVILSLYEYENSPYQWQSVAKACGLSRKILEVVDAQNAQNRKNGLPALELGLGIAFCDEPPTFLYDGDHRITISSAINRADQLSSCSAPLRRAGIKRRDGDRGVEVVSPVDQGTVQKERADQLLRYNVNGIELDGPAFKKLQTELSLRQATLTLPGQDMPTRFWAGRYPDNKGLMRWVVVREAPVRQWINNELATAEKQGRRFYEVITSPQTLKLVKGKLRQRRPKLPPHPHEDSSGEQPLPDSNQLH